MQQTKKYQFNLIDSSDPFSAQPLNDNMEKLEGALAAHRTEVSAALSSHRTEVSAALSSHRTEVSAALSSHRTEVSAALSGQAAQNAALPRMIIGSYDGVKEYGEHGPNHPTVLEFPEADRPPQVIFVTDTVYAHSAVLIRGTPQYCVSYTPNVNYFIKLEWTDTGVRFYSTDSVYIQFNSKLSRYNYVVLY